MELLDLHVSEQPFAFTYPQSRLPDTPHMMKIHELLFKSAKEMPQEFNKRAQPYQAWQIMDSKIGR